MNLPPSVARRLTDAGLQAEHVGTRGMARAVDEDILAAAKAAGEVVVTFDLDFGALLAVSGERSPSVIVLRLRDNHPDAIVALLATRLSHVEEELRDGAIVVFEETATRIRKLPVGG